MYRTTMPRQSHARADARVAPNFTAALRAPFSRSALAAELNSHLRNALVFGLLLALVLPFTLAAVTKPHIISFGKWMTVEWTAGASGDEKPMPIKVRPLMVDGRVKEYVTGSLHEITERLFVVRRVFRENDSLPDDTTTNWQWQRGGWLLVDRVTGHAAPINLPEFDPLYSASSWYRDYVAYCGISDDGKKTYAMVAQLNRRKPVLKKALADGLADDAAPDSVCAVPTWQRRPTRVSFEPVCPETDLRHPRPRGRFRGG
jgi:hypothetical protein